MSPRDLLKEGACDAESPAWGLLVLGAIVVIDLFDDTAEHVLTLGARGEVDHRSVLGSGKDAVSGAELAERSWEKLAGLLTHFNDPATGYVSRLLPLAEGSMEGDYDHLARVLEWSAGSDGEGGADGE